MSPFYILAITFLLHGQNAKGQDVADDPVRLPAKKLMGNDPNTNCPAIQDTIDAKDELRQNISVILDDFFCGDSTSGWRRVGYLDMTDSSQSCPSGLGLYSSENRVCGQAIGSGCMSTSYNTGGSQYSRVCGRIRGYQHGATRAFRSAAGQGIDNYYVNGVSLTHGSHGSRTHIWTFAAGLSQVYAGVHLDYFCRCVDANAPPPPSFVGDDYFCESGFKIAWDYHQIILYPVDPLWDGQNCINSCCQLNNPPYFTKTLPAPTTDDIELRICGEAAATTPIDQLELYVK